MNAYNRTDLFGSYIDKYAIITRDRAKTQSP